LNKFLLQAAPYLGKTSWCSSLTFSGLSIGTLGKIASEVLTPTRRSSIVRISTHVTLVNTPRPQPGNGCSVAASSVVATSSRATNSIEHPADTSSVPTTGFVSDWSTARDNRW
jgi:hypothetical protein